MSEVQARPSASRGRGSAIRAGRGGTSSRGGSRFGTRQNNGEALASEPSVSLEDQGELGQLKKHYMDQLDTLKELFPDWTDDDLVFTLQETDGDIQNTIEKITEGTVSRFSDVRKKTKEKKPKDFPTTSSEYQTTSTRGRGGRGGFEGSRGGRGRGAERSRGAGRGGRGGTSGTASGRTASSSVITTESPTWDLATETVTSSNAFDQTTASVPEDGAAEGQWASVITSDNTPATASEGQKSSLIPQGATKSWASMLAMKKPIPVLPKPTSVSAVDVEPTYQEETTLDEEPLVHSIEETEAVPPAPTAEEFPSADIGFGGGEDTTRDFKTEAEMALEITPSKDKLTEDNVEHLPDSSLPAPTETAASTIDASSTVGNVTPFTSANHLSAARPPMGGYATSAWKAAGTPGRSASFQRIMEQREAVVMPNNHAVDRTAVQFGSMGLNGDSNPLDIDDDREDAQTRAQPPQQSPPSQPRASLPPAPQQQTTSNEQSLQESFPTPKPAPGLPPVSQLSSSSISNQHISQHPLEIQSQGSQPYGQYSRYGTGSLNQEQAVPSQKPYDPFSQQLNYPQSQQEAPGSYPSHSQAPAQMQQPGQSHTGGFSQSSDYSSQQFNTEQQRSGFQNYYGSSYGQQGNVNTQENLPPPRSTSGFGAHESGFGSGQAGVSQSRFGESQNSGSNTPAPPVSSQPQSGVQSQQGQQIPQQSQGQPGHGGGYPYGNPYYNGSYYGNYMNQVGLLQTNGDTVPQNTKRNQQYPGYNYNQQGYGAPFGSKGGVYGQPHHAYGMSPQTSYEHSTTPSNAGGLGTSSAQGRDSTFSAGLGDYGRSSSTQQAQSQQHQASYNSYPNDQVESFGRSPSGLNQYGNQQGEGNLKPFQEQKTGTSPSMAQPGRTGSAANSTGYSGHQSNFAPPQSQQGFGGYPSHLHSTHGSQYGGLGGLGGGHQGNAQSHQGAGGYGSYGGGFGSNYSSYGRGGWGGNYGH